MNFDTRLINQWPGTGCYSTMRRFQAGQVIGAVTAMVLSRTATTLMVANKQSIGSLSTIFMLWLLLTLQYCNGANGRPV